MREHVCVCFDAVCVLLLLPYCWWCSYNVEDSDGTDRHHFNAIATAQDLNDTFLPAFQAGVTEGKASGIMCR